MRWKIEAAIFCFVYFASGNTKIPTIINIKSNNLMKKIAMLVLLAGLSLVARAQDVTLKGVVTDSGNQPVVGAFVVQQGTSNGTMTGAEGNFTLSAPAGCTVEISCISFVEATAISGPAIV